jgi:hypothetical protein
VNEILNKPEKTKEDPKKLLEAQNASKIKKEKLNEI